MTLEQRVTALATTVAARFNALPIFIGMPSYCLNPDAIPTDWLVMDGSAVAVSAYGALTAAIYCGDANNATAEWGYRCDNNDGSGRSTTGAYLVLPDDRDRYTRGWREGGDYDLWTYYADEIGEHTHQAAKRGDRPAYNSGTGTGYITVGFDAALGIWSNNVQNYNTSATGGPENRPRTSLKIPIIYAGPAA